MSAYLLGERAVVGQIGDVDTVAKNPVLTRCKGIDATGGAAVFVYLKGCTSTIVGTVVTYDDAGATTLLAANAKGPVAVAMAITVGSTWGWYAIQGTHPVDTVASSAANSTCGRETTDGKVGDGRAAGDEIGNWFQGTVATTGAAIVNHRFSYPFVNDFLGA
jgi:hypothetical protein